MATLIKLSANASESEINAAIAKLSGGGTLVFAKNSDITINETLTLDIGDKDITIDLNGSTLRQGGSSTVIAAFGRETDLLGIGLGTDAKGNATITYDTVPADLHVGSWVKVVADDALPHDHLDDQDNGNATRLGQAARVIAIDGNTVVLDGGLVDQSSYQTNVRATIFAEGALTFKNGTIDGTAANYQSGGGDLVTLRSVVGATVDNVTVSDSGGGLTFYNCVGATARDIVASNVWAGVHSGGSLDTLIDGLYAETVKHGVMVHGTGTVANAASASTYGADIGLLGTHSVVYGAATSAYEFHSETRNGTYSDVLAFNSQMLGEFRGIGNSMVDSGGNGNTYGLQFFEYGDGDGRNTLVDNVSLREIQLYALITSNTPLGNTVRNSRFESYGKGYEIPESMVKLINTSFKENVTANDDILVGTSDNNILLGGLGNDLLTAKGGRDYVWGGTGEDVLNGGTGRDRFAYNALNEGGDIITHFTTGAGGDILDVSVLAIRMGWDRDNFIAGDYIRAVQSGTSTQIRAHAHDGSWVTLASMLDTRASEVTASNIQVWLSDPTATTTASASDMTSDFTAGASKGVSRTVHNGTAGKDSFAAAAGPDLYRGSAGNDTYTFNHEDDLVQGEVAGGGKDMILSSVSVNLLDQSRVENLRLQDNHKNINGTGNNLDNTIVGNSGNNFLAGGFGNDRLAGKGGNDVFVFAEMGKSNSDTITDYGKSDHIALDRAVFGGLDNDGDSLLDASAFHLARATGNAPEIVYNRSTGMLSYDIDGAGNAAAQAIAMIGKNLAHFSADDILVL